MATLIKSGNVSIDHTPGSAVTAGVLQVVAGATAGFLLGYPPRDIAANEQGVLDIDGVWEETKLSTDVMTVGDIIYWDAGNSRLTLTSAGNKKAGQCLKSAGNGVTTVRFLLNNSLQ